MSYTDLAAHLLTATVHPVPYNSRVGGRVRLYGYALKEATGTAAAELDLYDGTDNTGLLAVPVTLTAGQSTRDWFGPQGVKMEVGLFPVLASGAVVGSLFIATGLDDPT